MKWMGRIAALIVILAGCSFGQSADEKPTIPPTLPVAMVNTPVPTPTHTPDLSITPTTGL
jgi:hypothetical protein